MTVMASPRFVRLDDPDADDPALIGAKAARLAELA